MREVGREIGAERRVQDASSLRPSVSPPPSQSSPQPRSSLMAGASYPVRRRRRPRAAAQRRGYGLIAIAVVVGALGFMVLTDGGRNTRQAQATGQGLSPWGDVDRLLAWAGFGLDQVSVAGHRFTADGDILDALELGRARSWRTFDSRAARDRIERLPWVATATLARRFPGQLDVLVTERKAVARWSHGGRETLIDATGRSLSDIRAGSAAAGLSSLPRFKGDGADKGAAAITATVARYPAIAGRVTLAERVAGRRWTLHLDNGTALVLPPDREAQVLAGLADSARLMRLIEEPGRVVDLRAPGRIAVRQAERTGDRPAPPGPRVASGGS